MVDMCRSLFNKLGRFGLPLAFLALLGAGVDAFFGQTVLIATAVSLATIYIVLKWVPQNILFGAFGLGVIFNKPFMLGACGLALAGFAYVSSIAGMVLTGTLLACLLFFYFAPDEAKRKTVQAIAWPFLRLMFRLEVRGKENIAKAGERVLFVANHPSYLDPVLWVLTSPQKMTFGMFEGMAKKSFVKFGLRFAGPFADIHLLHMNDASAIKKLAEVCKQGKPVALFPEGRLTRTGGLMLTEEGAAMIALKADAEVLPVRFAGLEYSKFTWITDKVNAVNWPRVRITYMPAAKLDVPAGLTARKAREVGSRKLHDVMTHMMYATTPQDLTLYQALMDAARVHGLKSKAVSEFDIETGLETALDYDTLLTASAILAKKLEKLLKKELKTDSTPVVGLMLPNSNGAVASFFAFQRAGITPAMINFTTGIANVVAGCKSAQIKTLVTSRSFVELAAERGNRAPKDIVAAVEKQGLNIIYLDDVRESVTIWDKLMGKLAAKKWRTVSSPDSPAVVLFTSGSEGMPKGVVLSHRNLLSNRAMMKAVVDFTPKDKVFNALPMFHSFGLLAGTLLPLFEGISAFMYPNPLDFKIVPRAVYEVDATIMFGTNTFLAAYAKQAHPYRFYNVRMAFAGAEKLQQATRQLWAEKFSTIVYEGYGATETSPVISACTPMAPKAGTVGRLMPGMEAHLEEVPGIDGAAQLFVKGPNVMLGYFKHDMPGIIQPVEDGWYDTGDIVSIDDEGFITIRGRAKRFVKVAGERLDMTLVESIASNLWPDYTHALSAVEDVQRGQSLVWVTNMPDAQEQLSALKEAILGAGHTGMLAPAKALVVDEVPLLGTGKIAYGDVDKLAKDAFAPKTA